MIVAPFAFAVLGLASACFTLWSISVDASGDIRSWRFLIPLALVTVILSALATRQLLGRRPLGRPVLREHMRDMWIVYPLLALSTAAFGGSHVSALFLHPFVALSGVVAGNLIARVASAHLNT